MANKDRKPTHKRKGDAEPTLAERADKLELYQRSVQDPEPEVGFMSRVYKRHRGKKPKSFREDFCGTAYLATTWVKSHPRRTAIGVDLHGPTLDWGREHVLGPERRSVRERVTLVQANVLDVVEPKVDVSCAFNFSYCVFKERAELGRYLRVAYQGLNDDGVFFCELFGGTEAIVALEEEREVGRRGERFTYVWEQEKYNPIHRHILCHIHFRFPDGSCLERAFTYDWRLWTIPEIRELMHEAGFSRTEVWWDPVDEDDYRITEEEENQEGWLVYIVAIK